MVKIVDAGEAAATLSALLTEIERGEEVIIARSGVPIAKLSQATFVARREPGAWRVLSGWKDYIYDRSTFAPLTDRETSKEGWP